jgi:hypothetical protein
MSIGASCGSATKPPKGSDPSEYWTPLIVFFQSGLPNQTAEFFYVKPPPAGRQKMPQLMHHDQQIEEMRTSSRMKTTRTMCNSIGIRNK